MKLHTRSAGMTSLDQRGHREWLSDHDNFVITWLHVLPNSSRDTIGHIAVQGQASEAEGRKHPVNHMDAGVQARDVRFGPKF